MKILQVMAGAPDGGAETACIDMCIAMQEAGQDVMLVTRGNSPRRLRRIREANIPLQTLPFGGVWDLYTPLMLRRVIARYKPDIVQTWMSRAAYMLPPRPHHGYVSVSRLGGYYKMKYFKNSDYFTTITPDIRGYLIKQGVAPERVRHINNFAETEDNTGSLDRAAMGVPADAPLVLALGRLHMNKAHDVLIQAVAQVPGLYLWIAGEGPERNALETLIQDLNVGDRIKLLGWRDDRAALLRTADICAFVSRYEPFGTVFVQAWANRTALVVSDADGAKQFVKPEQDGLMVAREDVDGLVAALKRLAADKDLRDRLAAQGFLRYQGEFTKAQSVQAYLDFYRAVSSTSA